MKLTAREHGHRARLDGGLPGGAGALPEHARRPALRPLRRGELPRLRRARPARVLRAAAHRGRAADDLAADAAGLPRRLRGARRLRADLLAPHLVEALGHLRRARRSRPPRPAATGCGSIDTEIGVGRRSRCSRSRSSACSSAGRPTRRSTRSSSATTASARAPLHRRHARVPREGRPDRARAERSPGSLLNVKPILDDRGRRGAAADARARAPEGVRGVPQALRGRRRPDGPGLAVGIAHAEAPDAVEQLRAIVLASRPAGRDQARDEPRRRRRHARRARARSASSGSRTRAVTLTAAPRCGIAGRSRQGRRESPTADAIVATSTQCGASRSRWLSRS